MCYELCTHSSAQSYLETIDNYKEWTAPTISDKKELQTAFEKCVNPVEDLRPSAESLADLPVAIQAVSIKHF